MVSGDSVSYHDHRASKNEGSTVGGPMNTLGGLRTGN